jgi:hypothetical protein
MKTASAQETVIEKAGQGGEEINAICHAGSHVSAEDRLL